MSNTIERKKVTKKKSIFSKCEQCLESFQVKRKWQRYCSRKCKFKAWAKMNPRVKMGGVQ